MGDNIGEVSAIANTTQQSLFPSQGPNAIKRSQFETQAAGHLVHMRKSTSSDYGGSLMKASKEVPGLFSVPVIAEANAIQKPIAQNLTVKVSARAKRTPFPGGLALPAIRKEIVGRQPKLRESPPSADIPATTFENNTQKNCSKYLF